MSEPFDSADGSPADSWRILLEAAAAQEPAWWMPPGRLRLDWTELSSINGQAKLAGLFGPRQGCDFPIAPDSENAEVGTALARLLDLVAEGRARKSSGPSGLCLGFPYLWIPPGLDDGAEQPPILIPLACLPVEADLNPAQGVISIKVRGNADGTAGEVQPNPLLVLWLEQVTGESQSGWLAELPHEPWRLLPRLLERVSAALKLPEDAVRSVTPFRPIPPLGSLPFTAAILPAAILGYFPSEPPRWQNELGDLLTGGEVNWPAGIFLGSESAGEPGADISSRGGNDTSLWWTGNTALAQAASHARKHALSVVTTPDPAAAVEVTTGLIGDHLSRGERVLVVSAVPEDCARIEAALQSLGLSSLLARTDDAGFTGASLREHLIKQLTPIPATGAPPPADSGTNLERLWHELNHRLAEAAKAVHAPGSDGRSFHELAGEWFELVAVVPPEKGEPVEIPSLAEWEAQQSVVQGLLATATRLDWLHSPWRDSLAVRPEVLRATSLSEWDRVFLSLMRRAELADKAFEGGDFPFSSDVPLAEQVTARQTLVEILQPLVGWDRPHFCVRVAMASPVEVEALARQRETLTAAAEDLIAQPLDADLWSRVLDSVPSLGVVTLALQTLESRLPNGPTGPAPASKAALAQVMNPLGLKPTPENLRRAWVFFRGLSHRLELAQMVTAWLHTGRGRVLDDQRLRRDWEGTGAILSAVEALNRPALRCLREVTLDAVREAGPLSDFIEALRRSTRSAQVLADFEHGVTATGLFAPTAFRHWRDEWNRGESRVKQAANWHEHVRELPDAAGLVNTLAALPARLATHVQWHVNRGTAPEIAALAIRRAACAGELEARRQQQPILREITGKSLQASYHELAELSRRRRRQLLLSIRRNWSFRRVNRTPDDSAPNVANGQILTELRPIWLTSPATALELFQQPGLFDVLVFLDGSRCPLAESLPLMTRARRVVILDTPTAVDESGLEMIRGNPWAGWELHGNGPDLLQAARSAGCAEVATASGAATPEPITRFNLPSQIPYSRVHPHPEPSRTLAAIGALWRNRCGVSNEIHWATPAGVVDIALINVTHPAVPRVGLLVDFPHSEAEPTAEWMSRWEALERDDWVLSPLWTPELVQRGEELLATLAAEAGIPPAPQTSSTEAPPEIWTDFSAVVPTAPRLPD